MLVKDFESLSAEQRSSLLNPSFFIFFNHLLIGTGREESAEEYIERKGMRLLHEEDGYHFCASSEDENGDPSEEEMVVIVIDGAFLDLEAKDAP